MKEILELFVNPDEMLEWLRKPFLLNGHTGATDRCTMIIVKDRLSVAAQISEDREKEVWGALPTHVNDFKIQVGDLKAAVSEVPLIDEVEEEDIECEACDVEGEVEYTFDHRGKAYGGDFVCPVCNGFGYTGTKETPTGKKVPDPNCVIQFGPCRLAAKYVSRLIKVAEFEGLETVSIVSTMSHAGCPVLFKVGETKVLIMPRTHEENDVVMRKFELI